jgi:hypothetical protein
MTYTSSGGLRVWLHPLGLLPFLAPLYNRRIRKPWLCRPIEHRSGHTERRLHHDSPLSARRGSPAHRALTRKFMDGGGRGRSAANADTPLSCHHTTSHRKVSSAVRSGASDPPTYVRLGQQHGEMFKVAAHLVGSGRLAPIVHPRRFDLSSAGRAYEAVWNGSARIKGRCRDSLASGPALPVQSAGSDETSHDSTRGELPALGH